MRKHTFWTAEISLLLIFAVMALAGFVIDSEAMWGMGLALFVLVAALIPVLQAREKHIRRYENREPLASWTYSAHESDIVARDILAWHSRRNRWVPWVVGLCLLFIGAVFLEVLHAQFPAVPIRQLLPLLLPAALPWLVRWLYRMRLTRTAVAEPCVTVIGRDFLIWGNTLPVFNEREQLKLSQAELVDREGKGYLRLLYKSSVRMRYGGWAHFDDVVLLLVPSGKEGDAKLLAGTIRDVSDKRS
jgi:hypothetical protein